MLVYVRNQVPESHLITGWVNGNLYIPSNKVSGVLPIPDDIRVKSGMGEYQALLHLNQPQKFLASMQGTRKPILPIHSCEECNLFWQLVAENVFFCISPVGNSHEILPLWQLAKHLRMYFNGDWKSQTNTKQTMAVTPKDCLPLKKALQDPSRSRTVPLATESTMQLHSVMKGFFPLDPPATARCRYANNSQRPVSTVETSQILSRKRTAEASTEVQPTKRKRQARSCRKCVSGTECQGRKEVKYCTNKCKDCGKVDCRG
ncbi:hypothetical protein L208DRAFT_1355534 [Tricholoma matsutake]|nr:hypothetical protein L208DRAFT_1355534 [Tricholoma matsutake 945]